MKIISNLSYLVLCLFMLSFFTGCSSNDLSSSGVKGTVTDIDGNTYQTITIGNQTWTIDNLRTTRYNNGDNINGNYSGIASFTTSDTIRVNLKYLNDSITLSSSNQTYTIGRDTLFAKDDTLVAYYTIDSIYVKAKTETFAFKRLYHPFNVTSNTVWSKLSTGGQCTYKNTTDTDSIAEFGRLYNYYAVDDSRDLAPTGWHVATESDWITLYNYIQAHTSDPTGKVLAASMGWATSSEADAVGNDLSKNNSSGFDGLPGGLRISDGTFDYMSNIGAWWCVSSNYVVRYISNSYFDLGRSSYNALSGLSIRCVKDAD